MRGPRGEDIGQRVERAPAALWQLAPVARSTPVRVHCYVEVDERLDFIGSGETISVRLRETDKTEAPIWLIGHLQPAGTGEPESYR